MLVFWKQAILNCGATLVSQHINIQRLNVRIDVQTLTLVANIEGSNIEGHYPVAWKLYYIHVSAVKTDSILICECTTLVSQPINIQILRGYGMVAILW